MRYIEAYTHKNNAQNDATTQNIEIETTVIMTVIAPGSSVPDVGELPVTGENTLEHIGLGITSILASALILVATKKNRKKQKMSNR